jgi:alpha,alpha-trehalose phosphorylase
VETARLWCSLGHHDEHGGFRIDGVTGPDEYSAIADNNVYTNLMAQKNLSAAAAACQRHTAVAETLGVDDAERAAWTKAADAMLMPYDKLLEVHPQSSLFTTHDRWDFDSTPADHYPLFLHYPYFDLYRKQVIKQADLVLAMHLCGDAFTAEEKARNFAYYEALTVRDSSLSACSQAVIAAEVGQLDLAYDYFAEAALTDLRDMHNNVRNGLHIASLAGAWTVAVAGFGGMRDHGGQLTFAPRLPADLSRLSFRLTFRGNRFCVDMGRDAATYRLMAGEPFEVSHHGESVRVGTEPVTMPVPRHDAGSRPSQPTGRAPGRRSANDVNEPGT